MRPYLVCLSWDSFTPKVANSLVRVLLVVVPLLLRLWDGAKQIKHGQRPMGFRMGVISSDAVLHTGQRRGRESRRVERYFGSRNKA